MHRHPDQVTDEDLLLIEVGEPGLPSKARLTRRRTRPRALPAFAIAPDRNGSHTLRCVEIGMGLAMPDHLLCAIPDGTIEINRTAVSDWERFVLLDETHHDWLMRLLRGGSIAASGDQPDPVTLAGGPILVSGGHRIDLAANLHAMPGVQPVQLMTMTGDTVSVILV